MSRFWQFNNVSADEGELILYGRIASHKSWWDDSDEGIYPKQFANDLRALGKIKNLTVRVNSGGGDVFAAVAIYTQLRSHEANITVIIDGIAASAATIIAMAGDTIKAPAAAQFMIHDPLAGLMGYYNTKDLAGVMGRLDSVKESILNAYVNKTGRDRNEIAEMMDKETWMTAEQAKAEGFVDEILFEESIDAAFTNDLRFMVVNSVAHDMSRFETRPVITQGALKKAPAVPMIPLAKHNTVKERDNTLEIKNMEDLKKHFPELCNQLELTAQQKERERIKAIDEISATVSEELVNKAKYDQPMSAQDLAFEALKADAGKGRKFINDRAKELEDAEDVKTEQPRDENGEVSAAAIDKIAASMNKKRSKEVRG
ncbi:head maturation protease, ClpP-related [Paenibacillus ehimensis]|uniref:head maturation protease, ClpP-related n=1 Tax=Paenibacillus ehimensis TaxID=79264 RepID=UPI000471915E|nr:head maturation protease, ClpP-related [Paenibacillus ehimensis]